MSIITIYEYPIIIVNIFCTCDNIFLVKHKHISKFHVNFAVKDSIGGWKDNALLYKSPRCCTTLKKLMGVEWTKLLNSGGLLNNTDCPVPPVN